MKPSILTTLFILTALLGAVALLSCDGDDCTSCPEPEPEVEPDYHVEYCCELRTEYWVTRTYSIKDGTEIDSAFYDRGDGAFWDAAYSPDGSLTYYTRLAFGTNEPDAWTWVTDTRSGDTLAIHSGKGGRRLDVSSDGEYLLVSQSRMLTLFKLPDLEVIYFEDWSEESGSFGDAAFHPLAEEFYYTKDRRGQDSIFIAEFNSSGVTAITARATHNRLGDAIQPSVISVSPNGKYLVTDAGIFLGPKYFQVRDTDSLSIIHETRIPDTRLHIHEAWHPDGKRIYMTFSGGFDVPDIGGIDVYNTATNTLQYYITSDEVSMDTESLDPNHIAITPDGDKIMVLNGTGAIPSGSILIFEVSTKQLIRIIDTHRIDMHQQTYLSYALGLNPIDWEKEK